MPRGSAATRGRFPQAGSAEAHPRGTSALRTRPDPGRGCHLPGQPLRPALWSVLSQDSPAPSQTSSLGWNGGVRPGARPPRTLRRGPAWEELCEVRGSPSPACLPPGAPCPAALSSDPAPGTPEGRSSHVLGDRKGGRPGTKFSERESHHVETRVGNSGAQVQHPGFQVLVVETPPILPFAGTKIP